MKCYIIAGEASGDIYGKIVASGMRKQFSNAELRGWGGDGMQEEGVTLVKHIRDLAFMGFGEVIRNLRTILGNIALCKKDILEFQPDVIILIDYPGFNMRIAKFAKVHNIPVHYFVAPQIWAWKKGRVHALKASIDRLYAIFPFEKVFYEQHAIPTHYVGHPLVEVMEDVVPYSSESTLPLLALLPGSRKQEIEKILPTMLSVEKELSGKYAFVLAAAEVLDTAWLKEQIGSESQIKIVTGQTREILKSAHVALVTSGTATLEACLCKAPQIVCYKTSALNYEIGKRVVALEHICIVNILRKKTVVTELIQKDCNTENLLKEIYALGQEEKRDEMLKEYAHVQKMLQGNGEDVGENIAQLIEKDLQKR